MIKINLNKNISDKILNNNLEVKNNCHIKSSLKVDF